MICMYIYIYIYIFVSGLQLVFYVHRTITPSHNSQLYV